MKKILTAAATMLMAATAYAGAPGATLPAEVLTLEACVDSALALNPAVNAAALEVEKARILTRTAFNPPMTEVTLKQETTGGGGPENGVYFGQEFDFPTLYVARGRSLGAQRDLAASRFDLLAADVEREVAAAYYEALHLQELLRLNAELGEVYAAFRRVAAARLEEGESGPLELMNAERVGETNAMEREQLLLDFQAKMTELRRLTGINAPSPALVAPPEPQWPSAGAPFSFPATLRGRAAGREVAVAEREESVALNELLPSLRVGATVQALIKSFNPYHIERLPFEKGNFMGFEVGISVPLFFGAQSARLKAARAEKKIALLRMDGALAEAQGEADRLSARREALDSRLSYFRETALPRADEIRRIAMVSYEYGDIDYIEYISNLETAYGVYKDYADCLNDYHQTLITLNNLYR